MLRARSSHTTPSISRTQAQRFVRNGQVLVNGQVATKPSRRLNDGDVVHVPTKSEPLPAWLLSPVPESSPHPDLRVLFQDEHVLVVHKPAQMVTHPAPGNATGTLVNAALALTPLAPCTEQLDESACFRDNACSSDGETDVHSSFVTPSGSTAPADLPDPTNASGSSSCVDDSVDCTREHIARPGIVHRLDKGTSGVMVLAKTNDALKQLAKQFKEHTVRRWYTAICCGRVQHASRGFIDRPIMRDPGEKTRMTALNIAPRPKSTEHQDYSSIDSDAYWAALDESFLPRNARSAISWYIPLAWLGEATGNDSEAYAGVTLMRWQLGTGRTHQVRVHSKHIGHPLLGDAEYGGARKRAVSDLRACGLSKKSAERLIAELYRPALHAHLLEFTHPSTNQRLRFTSPPPDDFMSLLRSLGAPSDVLDQASTV